MILKFIIKCVVKGKPAPSSNQPSPSPPISTTPGVTDGNGEPTQAVELSYREPTQILEESLNDNNGWVIKEDPNRKLFLHTVKDEIEKSKNQAEKKKILFISYAWEKDGSEKLKTCRISSNKFARI